MLKEGAQLTINQFNELPQASKESPGTECTPILDMARNAAGFNPLPPELKDNKTIFENHVNRVM